MSEIVDSEHSALSFRKKVAVIWCDVRGHAMAAQQLLKEAAELTVTVPPSSWYRTFQPYKDVKPHTRTE